MKNTGTILAVDDNLESLKMVTAILQQEGYQVRPANSGALALESMASRLPDLVLLDLYMPGLDGFEVCRRIKAEERTSDVPVIFLSAGIDPKEQVAGFEAGAVDFVSKPFHREELLARISTQLELARFRRHLAELVAQRTEELARKNHELQIASERLSLATRAANLGIWDWDVVKNELVWDDAMYGLYGIRREDFKGAYEAWTSKILPGDKEYTEGEIQAALRGERGFAPEFRINGPDGSIRYIKAESLTFRDQDGKALRMVGTNMDITERRRSEAALRESEERYRTLVSHAPVGIIVHRLGTIKFVNQAMADLIRIGTPASVSGKDIMPFLHPDDREAFRESLRSLESQGRELLPAEQRLVAPDGSVFEMEMRSIPISDQGENCIMTLVQDITSRKRSERELRAAHLKLISANDELEKRVDERTAQLVELNKDLEAFSYSAAHDMKGPLRRMNFFAEMLEKETGAELKVEPRGYLVKIRRSAEQMMRLVDGLLSLSVNGRKPLQLTPVPLSGLLAETIAEIKEGLPGRAIEWTTAALPEITCDRFLIRQIFLNILGNAVKYSRNSVPSRIEVLYSFKDGEHVISVKDNGVGFNMEHSDRLFKVFQRLHATDDFEGTGIGLSTVKRIVSRHGGRVWAESEPGKGATFYFTLPASPE